jgi:phage-related protein
MNGTKPLVWLHGQVKTPPFTREGRREAGQLLGMLQFGLPIAMPRARPMPGIGPRCHELRVRDEGHNWRIVCRVDPDAVIVAEVFAKTTRATPPKVIADCKRRLRLYDAATRAARRAGGGREESP